MVEGPCDQGPPKAGLSSTGSTGRVPAGALGLGGAGKQWGHQMGGYVQRVVGDGAGDPSWDRFLLSGAQHQRAHCRSYTRMVLPRDGGLPSSPPSQPPRTELWGCQHATADAGEGASSSHSF